MRLAATIAALSMADAFEGIEAAASVPEVSAVELRVDWMREVSNLERLVKSSLLPVIVVNRPAADGGEFRGHEDDSVRYLVESIGFGAAYFDVPLRLVEKYLSPASRNGNRLPEAASELLRLLPGQGIVSEHNTPISGIHATYNRGIKSGAAIVKIVSDANTIDESHKMLNLVSASPLYGRPLIGICMGPAGILTRVLAMDRHYDAFLTFASLGNEKYSLPGQPTVEEVLSGCRFFQLKVERLQLTVR